MSARRTTCLILAMAAATFAGTVAGRSFRPKPQPTRTAEYSSRLLVEAGDLDLGAVTEADPVERSIRDRNAGPSPVGIASWRTSCDCVDVRPAQVTIPAGTSQVIALSLRLTRPPVELSPNHPVMIGDEIGPTRAFRIRLSPVMEGEGGDGPEWVLAGRVSVPAAFAPAEVDFLDDAGVGRPPAERVVLVRPTGRCEPIECEVDSPVVRATAAPARNRNGVWVVRFQVADATVPGPLRARATIYAVDPEAGRRVLGALPVLGVILADLHAFPANLLLPVGRTGEEVEGYVALRSSSGQSIAVEELTVDEGEVSVEKVPRPPTRDTHLYRVRVKLTGRGAVEARVVFRARLAGGNLTEVIVPVTAWTGGVE